MKKLKILPPLEAAESIFYLESGPAYPDHPTGDASSINSTTPKPTTTRTSYLPKRFNKEFLLPAGVVRGLIIVI